MSNKYEDLIKNARMNADCGEHMSPEEVTTLLNVVETTFAALAAENAGLKAAIETHKHGFVRCNCCGDELMCHTDDVCRALDETPATDAFLAEVRAQGVEVFASKCKEESKRAHSSDARDSWWVSGENADDFASQLRKGAQS